MAYATATLDARVAISLPQETLQEGCAWVLVKPDGRPEKYHQFKIGSELVYRGPAHIENAHTRAIHFDGGAIEISRPVRLVMPDKVIDAVAITSRQIGSKQTTTHYVPLNPLGVMEDKIVATCETGQKIRFHTLYDHACNG